MTKIQSYLKLILVLAVSFLISSFCDRRVFLAHSPRINPFFGTELAENFTHPFRSVRTYLASITIFTPSPEKALKDVPFSVIAPGVYAKTKGNTSYTLIKEDEVVYVEYQLNIDGKIIKVKVPQGQPAPVAEMFK